MKTKSLFVLLAAALLVSCSKSENDAPVTPVAGNGEILVGSPIVGVNSSLSRAAYEGTGVVDFKALVLASLTSGDYTTLHCGGAMTFNDGENSPFMTDEYDGERKYDDVANTPDKDHFLFGLYPFDGWSDGGTAFTMGRSLSTNALTFSLTGKEDVMLAAEASSNYEDTYTASTISVTNLAFEHQLTLMKLKLQESVVSPATASGIVMNSIKLVEANGAALQTEFTANLDGSDHAFAVASSPVASLDCYVWDGTVFSDDAFADYELTDAAVEQAYVIAPPVTATAAAGSYEYTFEVTYTEGDNETIQKVYVDLRTATGANNEYTGDTTGKAFDITFKLVAGKILATASITDWDTVGDFEHEI